MLNITYITIYVEIHVLLFKICKQYIEIFILYFFTVARMSYNKTKLKGPFK